MIAEIQFLVTPMLEDKKRGHEIYEVERTMKGLMEPTRSIVDKMKDVEEQIKHATGKQEVTRLWMRIRDDPQLVKDDKAMMTMMESMMVCVVLSD